MCNIEYYHDDWETGKFFVCFDRYYIFEINPKDQRPEWLLLEPQGAHWDMVHQRIYRNFRADQISKKDLPSVLPPPPETAPTSQALEKVKAKPAPTAFEAYRFPNIAKKLRGLENFVLNGVMVLHEDTYESQQGDGKFHDPDAYFNSQEEALAYVAAQSKEYAAFHLRVVSIAFTREGLLHCPAIEYELFDQFLLKKCSSWLKLSCPKLAGQTLGLNSPTSFATTARWHSPLRTYLRGVLSKFL